MSQASNEWFLDVKGRKTGPWTTEQLQDLLSEGEVLPIHRVCPSSGKGEWITIQEAIHGQFQMSPTGTLHLPPRPSAEIVAWPRREEGTGLTQVDSTKELFDVLQSAKERKPVTPPKLRLPAAITSSSEGNYSPIRTFIFGASAATALGLTVWAIIQVMHANSSAPAAQSIAAPKMPSFQPPAAVQAQRPAQTPPTQTSTLLVSPPRLGQTISMPSRLSLPAMKTIQGTNPARDAELEKDREREREKREDAERIRENEGDRREPDWRARDDRGEAVQADREHSDESGNHHLAPAPISGPPPGSGMSN